MIPFIGYTMRSFMNSIDNPKYPNGATKQIVGRISLYEDTFWYVDSSQKHEFNFSDYNIDNSYERGESIYIYLDDNNNIVSVSHKTEDYSLIVNVVLMFIIPIILLLLHAFVGRKTYAKNWSFYRGKKKTAQPDSAAACGTAEHFLSGGIQMGKRYRIPQHRTAGGACRCAGGNDG